MTFGNGLNKLKFCYIKYITYLCFKVYKTKMDKITHNAFINILHKDYGECFIKVLSKRTFNDLIKEIDHISDNSGFYGYSDSDDDTSNTGKNKFVGDLFEIFTEAFFIQFKSDNRIGIFDYKPVPSEDDNGVDGFGKNISGLPCTIQIKYRSNPTYKLTERDIKQFAYQSIINYNVDYKRNDTMIIFTNCDGLHWYTESKVFDNKLRVINGKTISKLIDNNEGFWNSFKEIIINSVNEVGIDKLTEIFKEKL